MTTNNKNWFTRLVEFCVRRQGAAAQLPERPAMDAAENDRVLLQAGEQDQVYRTLMNYAFVHVENNLSVAFDPAKSVDERRDFNSRAAGVAAFIADVESTRARLKEELLAKQRLEAKKK